MSIKYCYNCKKFITYYGIKKRNRNVKPPLTVFCSALCREEYRSKVIREEVAKQMHLPLRTYVLKCKGCNREFIRKYVVTPSKKPNFCSTLCREKYGKLKKSKTC